jgi:hypothetical protein
MQRTYFFVDFLSIYQHDIAELHSKSSGANQPLLRHVEAPLDNVYHDTRHHSDGTLSVETTHHSFVCECVCVCVCVCVSQYFCDYVCVCLRGFAGLCPRASVSGFAVSYVQGLPRLRHCSLFQGFALLLRGFAGLCPRASVSGFAVSCIQGPGLRHLMTKTLEEDRLDTCCGNGEAVLCLP